MPRTQRAVKARTDSAVRRTDCRKLYAMTGRKTFSSKLPWEAAMPTAASLPMTWTATMVTCSHWVGLTFPGMIELPGSLAGIVISPRPQRGPEASQRTSLAIFIMSPARALTAPWAKTSSSREERAWNLFFSDTKGLPVSPATSSAAFSAKPSGAFRPVPTAVPPRARPYSGRTARRRSSRSRSREARQPLISCEKAMGTASCRWVRPLLTMPAFSRSSTHSASFSSSTAGISASSSASTAAMCSAVGKVSLEDWLMFTSSFGWQRAFPARAFARLAMTSLTFMLVWVPEPVCQTTRGKCPANAPERTSSAALAMTANFSSVIFAGSSVRLARAAASFRMPKAVMISSGMVSCPTPMGKFSTLRWVWAPQRRSAGTATSPIASCSSRLVMSSPSLSSRFFPIYISDSARRQEKTDCSLQAPRFGI